ncbi:phosphoglucomutase-2-like protein [Leptotrombidium deliense]|uniref:Phosphoglucomutase-2-like protein n=1 Tax=Leptotrombidium deliense TaxID=299467 RepID=A0A443SJC9_9ACAR|nr:phosphoglucomutase-2-like protein [Leptotrombidium deliense]
MSVPNYRFDNFSCKTLNDWKFFDLFSIQLINVFILQKNPATNEAIRNLVTNNEYKKLECLLLERQSFGTAGIRGKMGAGYSGMNDLVVIQTSQGLAKYLLEYDPNCQQKGVVIGFDARHNSDRFAKRAAAAFIQKNIPVYLFSKCVPTPFVPFGIKLFNASCGIVVTASHNPKDDNGYKVFFSNGAQILSPHDKNIQKCIEECLAPWEKAWDLSLVNKCKDPFNDVSEKYYESLKKRILDSDMIKNCDLKVTYTVLHGVGHNYVTEAFKVLGLQNYYAVKEQMEPNPDFPTAPFPNPEETGVLDLSIKRANETDSSLIIANDPDVDRCAAAERQEDGSFKIFTGNEIGTLLGWWLWLKHKLQNPDVVASDCYMIASAVSSKNLASIAKKEGFNFLETLTGFKWMGNRADELIKTGKTVLFAYEEAIGYMCGSYVLDKDGITAAVELAQMSAYLKTVKQSNLKKQLSEIYKIYGYHHNINSYFLCYDQRVIRSIFERMANFNGVNTYPNQIGKYKVTRVRDLQRGFDSGTAKHKPELPSSPSNFMLTFYFDNGVTVTVRTSGTEPKIKYYSEIIAAPDDQNWSRLQYLLNDVISSVVEILLEPEKNGLQKAQ